MPLFHCRAYRQPDGKIVTQGLLHGRMVWPPVPKGEFILEQSIQADTALIARRIFLESLKSEAPLSAPGETK